MRSWQFVIVCLFALAYLVVSDAPPCSASSPCAIGCCGKYGVCGLGPTFCGSGNCTANCDRKSDCDPGWGAQWSNTEKCPLNVCCSQYGFCGTTSEFCGSATVKSPSCSGTSSSQRTIGYYEGWATTRNCYGLAPDEINYNAYTHLNYAFAFVDPNSFTIAPMSPTDPEMMQEVANLKQLNPGLKIWLSVGGWSMNDADQPTHAAFSSLANSASAQAAFGKSLLQVMGQYGFDGVDIDWEYPVAQERSGQTSDFTAYPTFMQNLRGILGASGHSYGLSLTLPSSYWYMQHFDIVNLEKYVDWFNIMTYDLHGTWDSTDPYIGPIVGAHTNLTEIDQALDLLWRNNIDPAKVNLGIGFYGRSFTLSNPSCTSAGCPFSAGGNPGACSQSAGTLMYSEIEDILPSATVTFDKVAGVKIAVWNSNQWVSYDDADTLKLKFDYANKKCLGGLMVWAASTDDEVGTAISALTGVNGRNNLTIAAVSNTKDPLTQCVWGSCGKGGASCPSGMSPAQRSDGGGNKGNAGIYTGCPKGQQRNYCCPNNHPTTCQWRGTASICAHAGCAADEVGVASDKCGTGKCCDFNHKNLCCKRTDSDFAAGQCEWQGSAPYCTVFGNGFEASCPSGQTALTADKQGAGGESVCGMQLGYKSFCCNQPAPYTGCAWSDNGKSYDYWPPLQSYRLVPIGNHVCSGTCPAGKVVVAADSSTCSKGTTALFCCDNPTAVNNPIPIPDTEQCSLSTGLIPESDTPEDDDPSNSLTEIEEFDWEADCWISDISSSGGDTSLAIYHDETKRDTFDDGYHHLLDRRHEFDDDEFERLLHEHAAEHSVQIVKRTRSRKSVLCKNPPGRNRKTITTGLVSSSYRNAQYLVAAGKYIYYYDKTGCAKRVLKTAKTVLPAGYKFVTEHVWEIQGVKSFLQSCIDGRKPGNVALSIGKLAWAPFDKTAANTASFFKTWASQGVTLAAGLTGSTPEETFYALLGSLSDTTNTLILEAKANGMKAIVFAGAASLVEARKWKKASHTERLGTFQTIRVVFDYLNSADAQSALSYVYSKTQLACQAFQTVLKNTNAISFDMPSAFKEWATSQYGQMTTNTVKWINGYMQDELDYWSTVKTAAGAANYQELLDLKNNMGTWTVINTNWIK